MTDQSLFQEAQELQIDPNKDYLPELVGEGKKFKTTADLARSALHKDSHIARLERETRELREDLTKRVNMEDFMARLDSSQKALIQGNTSQTTSVSEPPDKENVSNETKETQLSIEERIKGILASERSLETQANNLRLVQEKLTEALGDDFVQYIEDKAKSLSLSRSDMDTLAKTKPQVFLKLLDLPEALSQKQSQMSIFNPARSGVNTTPVVSQKTMSGRKTFKQWQEVRKSDPQEYHRQYSKVHADALALGEDFYS